MFEYISHTFMKYVNQPVMNAAQKMRLKMTKKKNTKKHSIVENEDLILKKDMGHKEITREEKT